MTFSFKIFTPVRVVFSQGDKGDQGRDGKKGEPGICDIKVCKGVYNFSIKIDDLKHWKTLIFLIRN